MLHVKAGEIQESQQQILSLESELAQRQNKPIIKKNTHHKKTYPQKTYHKKNIILMVIVLNL